MGHSFDDLKKPLQERITPKVDLRLSNLSHPKPYAHTAKNDEPHLESLLSSNDQNAKLAEIKKTPFRRSPPTEEQIAKLEEIMKIARQVDEVRKYKMLYRA